MGKLKKPLLKNGDSLENIKQGLVDVFNWLNNVQQNFGVVSSQKGKNEISFILLQLKKQISNSISTLNTPACTEKQKFVCGICDREIVLEPLQEIWEHLENHSHLKSNTNVEKGLLCNIEHRNISILDACNEDESNSEYSSEDLSRNGIDNCKDLDNIEEIFHDELSTHSSNFNSTPYKSNQHKQNLLASKSCSWYPISPLNIKEDYDKSVCSDSYNNSQNEISQPLNSITHEKIEGNVSYDSKYISNLCLNNEQSDQQTLPKTSTFTFNFKPKYSSQVESLLYQKFYRQFDLEGYPILQKTGPERMVCLSCCCEMLGSSLPSNTMGHLIGSRHTKTLANSGTKEIIRIYHDSFLGLDREYQSHQIYFATDESKNLVKCVACVKYVKCWDVEAHIKSELHKEKLILMSAESKLHSLFYFLPEHVEGYGINNVVSKNSNESTEVKKSRRFNTPKQHKIVRAIDKFSPILDNKVPGRFSNHLKYLRLMDDTQTVTCIICKTKPFNWKDIPLHLIQPSHLAMTKTETLNYVYHCDVCDRRYHDEMSWIIHFQDNDERHKEAQKYKESDQFNEYECSTCKFVLFGYSETLDNHRKTKAFKRREKIRTITLSKEIKEFFSSKKSIRKLGNELLADAEAVVINNEAVQRCCKDLENAIKIKYPSCKAYPFGSRVSGLGCSESDLDIFVDIGSMYSGNQNQDEQNQTFIITSIMSLMTKSKEFKQMTSIPTARTPIIKLTHKSTKLECDISFVHGLSVENTKFLRYCFDLQPISQKLILLLKKWSHLCGLNENISTYALAMLVIFYLQKNNFLLSVQTLKELNKKNLTIVGWETIDYVTPKEEIIGNIKIFRGDVIELLNGFFEFYMNFNYKLHVVCPLLGTEIDKDLFSIDPKGSALPEVMSSYVRKLKTDSSPEYFRCLSHFCIQDPFDLSHNLTKACSSVLLNKFLKLCELSKEMLTKLDN